MSSKFLTAARRSIKKHPELFEALLEFERTKKLPEINSLKSDKNKRFK